jgi:hypothetical protein
MSTPRDCSGGKRFVVRADEMLTAFVELQRAIHEFAVEFGLVMTVLKRRG